jgi:hypothetical protein
MGIIRGFGILFVLSFVLWLVLGGGKDPLIGLVVVALVAGVIVAWAYAVLLLYDTERIGYQILALLFGGIIGIIALLGLRWIYKKTGLGFLS